jgi:hypothetical protein
MIISEVAGANSEAARLVALSQFLLSRAQDTNTSPTISTQAFLQLANNMGIALTTEQLKDISQTPPLSNIISDVTGDENNGQVVFRGGQEVAPEMSVDQARLTVDSMAKRAAKKGI